MASTLAAQLAAISQQSVNTLDRKKHVRNIKSLLFDQAEAADQDYETVFAIAVNGYVELRSLDHRFDIFEKGLFSESSKGVNRDNVNAKENEDLDVAIVSFVQLLAPHFLLRSASKALEWLIRRFKAHEKNAAALIMAFLPYHTHPLFARLLSILTLPEEWSFLSQWRKARQSPTKASIVKQLSHPTAPHYTLLSDFLISAVQKKRTYHALASFWAAYAVEAITLMRTTGVDEEKIVERVLPGVADGMKFKHAPEFQIANYMIITALASRATLDDVVIKALMDAVAISWGSQASARRCGLICLAQLAQMREGTPSLPRTTLKAMENLEGGEGALLEMGDKYRVDKLWTAYCLDIIENVHENPAALDKVLAFVKTGKLSSNQVATILKTSAHAAGGKKADAEVVQKVSAVLEDIRSTSSLAEAWTEFTNSLGPNKVKQLEMKLTMTLTAEVASDVPMLEAAPAVESAEPSLEEKLASIKLDNEKSFLAAEEPASAKALLRLWDDALANEKDVSPILASLKGDVATITFLVYAWTRSARETSRVAAVNALAFTQEKVDYQLLVPHLIVALADGSAAVRQAAADALKALQKVYEKQEGKKSVVWAQDVIYASPQGDAEVELLKWAETTKLLVEVVGPKMEECVQDEKFVVKAVGGGLAGAGKKGKENTWKTSVYTALASHVIACPLMATRLLILSVLNGVAGAASLKGKSLLAVLEKYASKPDELRSACNAASVHVVEMEQELVKIVEDGKEASTSVLRAVIAKAKGGLAVAAVERAKAIWETIKDESKFELVKTLLQVAADGAKDVVAAATAALDEVFIDAVVLSQLIAEVQLKAPAQDATPAKRQKGGKAAAQATASSLQHAIQQLTALLELVERKGADKYPELLGQFFGILGDLLTVEIDLKMAISYPQQLLLSTMTPMVENYTGALDAKVVRIDTLVNCIRNSVNPQVHNRALLLVSALSDVAPETVLHSVMPIFTFMGANVLRQDDSYSAHVIQQTIERVVPPLVNMYRKNGSNVVVDAAGVLSSFVNAFSHIPVHRRLKLFLVLVQTLGAEEFLHGILALLAEKRMDVKGRNKDSELEYLDDFCLSLGRSFGVETELIAVQKLIDLAGDLPLRAASVDKKGEYLFNFTTYTDERFARLKEDVLNLASLILGSKQFRVDLASYARAAGVEAPFQDRLASIVEKLLAMLGSAKVAVVTDALYKALDKTLLLLPMPAFTATMEKLVVHSDIALRRKSIAIVRSRVEKESPMDPEAQRATVALLPLLVESVAPQGDGETIQIVFDCIGSMAGKYGKPEASAFAKVVEPIIGNGGLLHENVDVRVSALVCLSIMSATLGPRLVPSLPKIVPPVLDMLGEAVKDESQDLVELASYSLLEGLVKVIPSFLGGYMKKTFIVCFTSAAQTDKGDEIVEVRRALLFAIAERVAANTVLTALFDTWTTVFKLGKVAVLDLFDVLEEVMRVASRAIIGTQAPTLMKFFLSTFDMRKNELFQGKVLQVLESRAIDVFIQMVMKLNDTTFRPLYLRLVDWVFGELQEKNETQGALARQIFYYRFLATFMDAFKSVVSGYIGPVVDHTVELLSQFTEGKVTTPDLWHAAIGALEKCFAHAEEGYWQNPAYFDKVAPALIAQATFAEAVNPKSRLIPAIVELAAASPSDDHFKSINTQVLQHMRSDNANVRLTAVKAETALYGRVGEEWLTMLPQTVPFIAEAMEDEDENVERATQALIVKIESYLGESLQKFLT
ncbi:snoRNA-binding rRNA-processing protein utp10 [Saitoella coloradoensis]